MKPYYLYTGGVLKRVEREKAQIKSTGEGPFKHWNGWLEYLNSLPSIQVSDDLKRSLKEGDRPVEGKDFKIAYTEDDEMLDIHEVYTTLPHVWPKLIAIPLNVKTVSLSEQEERVKEERTFTLKEASEIWDAAYKHYIEGGVVMEPRKHPAKIAYFKQTFNIDITK